MASPAKLEPSAVLEALAPARDEQRLDPRAYVAVGSREEAEYLLMLDHSGAESGPEWRAFLVEALVGFLVWQRQPFGEMSETDLDWFLGWWRMPRRPRFLLCSLRSPASSMMRRNGFLRWR